MHMPGRWQPRAARDCQIPALRMTEGHLAAKWRHMGRSYPPTEYLANSTAATWPPTRPWGIWPIQPPRPWASHPPMGHLADSTAAILRPTQRWVRRPDLPLQRHPKGGYLAPCGTERVASVSP